MRKPLTKALASALVAALLLACPGLGPCQALAGVVDSRAPEPVQSSTIHVDSSRPGQLPVQAIPEAGALSALPVEAGLHGAAAAATAAGVVAAPDAAAAEQRLDAPPLGGADTGSGEAPRDTPAPVVDFDHAGVRASAPAVADTGIAEKTRSARPQRRYYVYETRRDYKITAPAKAIHFGSIGLKMAGKLWLLALWNKTVAVVAGAAFVLIPPKLMVFLRLYSGLHLTFASPALARHAPMFADRREVLQPHEELGQIPGVLRTIDVSERHDTAEGFSYFGSFLSRRVEEHRTLVMADRALPAEVRAQDGGLLGRLRELEGDAALVLRARTRVGGVAATWRRSVDALFSGDVMDPATGSAVRAGLDDQWLRSAATKLLTLAAGSVAVGLGLLLPFEHFGIAGAHTYAELAAAIYFIVAGVFDHSGGPRIFRKYFFLAKTPEASRWARTKRFLSEAWQESKEHHAPAVTVGLERAAGEEPLGDIARGGGAHAFAGNGLRRQLGLNSPHLLGLMAVGAAALKFSVAVFASSSWPLAAAGALAAGAALAYAFLVPRAAAAAQPGLSIRKHDADGRLTALLISGLIMGGLAVVLGAAGHWVSAVSVVAALAAVVVVLDPFTSKGAAAYDARLRASSIPWGQGAFILGAMLAGLVVLPAPSIVAGEALVATLAIMLASLYGGLKHVFNPPVRDVRTPRSTPALASEDLAR